MVYIIVGFTLLLWFDRSVAFWAGAGASAPIAISGNKGWAHRRVLPWALLVIIAMGVVGGLLGAIIAD